MGKEKLEELANKIVKLTPNDKGLFFSIYFAKEKDQMTGKRSDLRGSIKLDKELTDEEIESCLYNPNIDDLIK